MQPAKRRVLLGVLAVVGLAILVATVVTVLLAPDATPTLLMAFLAVLVLVLLAEVLVFVMDRRSA